MSNANICRGCKHWGGPTNTLAAMVKASSYVGHPSYWESRPAEALEYLTKSRAECQDTRMCEVLQNTLYITLDHGSGWGGGGASVNEIETPGDFGCAKFEPWEGA